MTSIELQDDITQDWTVSEDNDTDYKDNLYIKSLKQNSGLKILQTGRVYNAYNHQGNSGLFSLFLNNSF